MYVYTLCLKYQEALRRTWASFDCHHWLLPYYHDYYYVIMSRQGRQWVAHWIWFALHWIMKIIHDLSHQLVSHKNPAHQLQHLLQICTVMPNPSQNHLNYKTMNRKSRFATKTRGNLTGNLQTTGIHKPTTTYCIDLGRCGLEPWDALWQGVLATQVWAPQQRPALKAGDVKCRWNYDILSEYT